MEMKKHVDIFDFAISAERDGMDFYWKASEKFEKKELKEIFMRLAREEHAHIDTFMKMKADVEQKGTEELFTVPDTDEFVESIIHDGLFPKGENAARKLEGIDSIEAACVLAMQAEKNAILLYSELARLSTDSGRRKVFEKLAREEKSHMVTIRQLRADHDPMYAALSFGRFF
jgi:rubrerythrin